MTTKQHVLVLAAAVSLALAGCATDNTGWHSASDPTGTPDAKSGSWAGLPDNPQAGATDKMRMQGQISHADMVFIRDVEAGNQYEMSAAGKAMTNSSNQDVKDLAHHMSDDHMKANSQLTNLALRKSLPDNSGMTAEQLQMLSKLDGLSGNAFDREYVNQQLTAHRDTIAKFKSASQLADDKDLRDWATATLPTLENHLTLFENESRTLDTNNTLNNLPNNPGNNPSIPARTDGM